MHMFKCFFIILLIIPSLLLGRSSSTRVTHMGNALSEPRYVKAPNNAVSDLNLDNETVVRLGETVLIHLYGEKVLQQTPWKLSDLNGELKIEGSLPEGHEGDVAEIVIRKSDGKVKFASNAHAVDSALNEMPKETFLGEKNPEIVGDLILVDLKLNEETATKLIETILVYIYGEKVLKQRPWIISENKNEFKFFGVLQRVPGMQTFGGTATIVIRKTDAKILYYTHGR